MTTFSSDILTCAVCRVASEFQILSSTSTFGSYDLDLRPPPLSRYTIGSWVQECPECGYTNDWIEKLIPGAPAIVVSPEFTRLRVKSDAPSLVSTFQRHALLLHADPRAAGWALLHAAWVCDDLKLRRLALECRSSCVGWWNTVEWPVDANSLRNQIVMVDVLRRAGKLRKAEALSERLLTHPSLSSDFSSVLGFQKLLIARDDTGRHTCDEALSPASPSKN